MNAYRLSVCSLSAPNNKFGRRMSLLSHGLTDISDDASDDSMSLSEKTSVLERREMVNVNVKQARFWMMEKDKSNGEKETPAPLMKQCTSTNKYLENFLQRIEDLEDGLKEREDAALHKILCNGCLLGRRIATFSPSLSARFQLLVAENPDCAAV